MWIRLVALLFLLASTADAQRLQITQAQAGGTTDVTAIGLDPGVSAGFQVELLDAEHRVLRRGSAVATAGRTGRAGLRLPVPVLPGSRSLRITMTTPLTMAAAGPLAMAVPVLPEGPSPLLPDSDDFNGTALDPSWTVYNAALVSYRVTNGRLQMVPTASGLGATWFNNREGPFIHKVIEGDFDVTSTVRARPLLSPSGPVPTQYRLAGIMVRDVDSVSGNRNSAHIAVGAGDNSFPIAVEDKTTYASSSDFFFHAVATQKLELRITRVGDLISRFYRPANGGPWTLMRADLHPEFGPTAQVGAIVYSNNAPVDIYGTFGEIAFH